MLRKCPFCHRLFQAEEVKKELLGADKLVTKDPLVIAEDYMKWEWQDNFDKEKHVHTFRVSYKCKHCGHEWTDLMQKK